MIRVVLVAGLVLFALWLFGVITSTILGGAIHILLVVSAILIVFWFVTGRKKTE